MTKLAIVFNLYVCFAVLFYQFYGLAIVKTPMGNESSVAHVSFFYLMSRFNAS